MEGPRVVVLLIIFLILFLTPDQPTVRRQSQAQEEHLALEKRLDFDVLANSTYGELASSGLNLTGFRVDDGYQWQILPTVQKLSRKQHDQAWENSNLPVYRRVNGEVRGDFIKTEIATDKLRSVNLTELDPRGDYLTYRFQRNVTESKGQLAITLNDVGAISDVGEIKAAISIYTDSSPGNGWEARLHGVHFSSGSIILSTSSRKYNAMPALPHFSLSEREFNQSRLLMNESVTRMWERVVDFDVTSLTTPNCELVVWLHQKPVPVTNKYISIVENELLYPDGAPILEPPPLAFSAVIFSPDCGYVLEADAIFGPKEEAYWMLVRRLLAAFIIMLCLEIVLLKRQMEKCATPSTRSRISYYSIGIAAFGDGLTLFAMIGLLMIDGGAFLLAAAAAFLCCIHVAFLEVKFIFDIWTVQVGDPAQAQRERQRRAAATATNSAGANVQQAAVNGNNANPTVEGGLPLPATARSPGIPPTVVITPDQGGTVPGASFASLYSRFYFSLVNLMFFSLWAMTWPSYLRAAYVNILTMCYFSLWLPQIYRNIMRNCRKALNWEYVIGTSILRSVPVLYWYIDDGNLLAARTNSKTALLLLGWLFLQVSILLIQQFLGPRIFVKNSWCPPAYDYHPILHDDDLESGGMPIGELASASEGKDKEGKRRKVFDCAICMNEIDVPVVSKDEGASGRGWLEQRNYMVTPCRHIFHSECLEGWMNLRLVCPVCREGLPPM